MLLQNGQKYWEKIQLHKYGFKHQKLSEPPNIENKARIRKKL